MNSDWDLISRIAHALYPFVSNAILIAVFFWRLQRVEQRNVNISGQPIRTLKEKELVTADQLHALREEYIREQNKLEQRMSNLERKLDSDKGEIIKAGSERGRLIHEKIEQLRGDMDERIDTVLRAVSRVEGAIEEARSHR